MTEVATTAAGAVLAGGASRRFGTDKSQARLGGSSLLERVVDALRHGGADPVVAVGGADAGRGGLATVADLHPGEGPLGGVVTALRWSPRPCTVVVAADLALLDAATVAALAARAGRCPGSVAVARADGRLQPTCACWPATARPALERALADGERSIARLLAVLAVEPVDVPDRVVADVDTPAQLEALASRWSR